MDAQLDPIRQILKEYLLQLESEPDIREWITRQGVKITEAEKSPRHGPFLLRSEYKTQPPEILVYQDVMEIWHKKIVEEIGVKEATIDLLKELCLVHEFLHDLFYRTKTHFSGKEARIIKKISLRQEEALIREMVRDWMKSRYPQYNDQLNLILDMN
jgi:hypothetical protein